MTATGCPGDGWHSQRSRCCQRDADQEPGDSQAGRVAHDNPSRAYYTPFRRRWRTTVRGAWDGTLLGGHRCLHADVAKQRPVIVCCGAEKLVALPEDNPKILNLERDWQPDGFVV